MKYNFKVPMKYSKSEVMNHPDSKELELYIKYMNVIGNIQDKYIEKLLNYIGKNDLRIVHEYYSFYDYSMYYKDGRWQGFQDFKKLEIYQ